MNDSFASFLYLYLDTYELIDKVFYVLANSIFDIVYYNNKHLHNWNKEDYLVDDIDHMFSSLGYSSVDQDERMVNHYIHVPTILLQE